MGFFDFFKKGKRDAKSENCSFPDKGLPKEDLSEIAADREENFLFWAPSIFDGDPLMLDAPDYEIHVFAAAAEMLADGEKIRTDNPLPQGYRLAQEGSGKILHLRTILNPMLNLEMVPLFTDPNLLLRIFTPNTRVSIVDYQSARSLCVHDKKNLAGIVINPGRDNKIIPIDQLKQAGSSCLAEMGFPVSKK